ncbi:MAG: hypothetical protein KGJ62_11715 [Armatimonadetes bacterium]|nr:hypothetical protein [Armatimonadota bacterium]MDE2206791.1 hypothetical protein [Armatimonadota bacterium]
MPTYAYRCTACRREFTTVQKMSDDPLKVCPDCGGPVVRLLAPVGIVFKGSGWYVNDSRAPDTSELPPKADAAPAKDGQAGAEAGSAESAKAPSAAPAGKAGKAEKTTPAASTAATPDHKTKPHE